MGRVPATGGETAPGAPGFDHRTHRIVTRQGMTSWTSFLAIGCRYIKMTVPGGPIALVDVGMEAVHYPAPVMATANG